MSEFAADSHQGRVGRIWSEAGNERVEAYGFRFCGVGRQPVMVSVRHAVRDGDTWADFGSGPQPIELLHTCETGDVAIYAAPTEPAVGWMCLSVSDPAPDRRSVGSDPSSRVFAYGAPIAVVSGTMSSLLIDEWSTPAMAFELTQDEALSGALVVNEYSEPIGMVFGRTTTDSRTLATPIALVERCVREWQDSAAGPAGLELRTASRPTRVRRQQNQAQPQ